MTGSSLNREDYKTAIPQLASKMDEILNNNVIINRTVINLSEGKVSDLNSYLGYFQNLATGYFEAIAGDIQFLTSHAAYVQQLESEVASFGYLTADSADIRDLKVGTLTIDGQKVNVWDKAVLTEETANEVAGILDDMSDAAQAAETTLTQIFADAKIAEENASVASSAARTAVYGLSQVEDVVGTIRWIERNGKYEETHDEYVKKGKAYYELINGSYVMVTNPVQEDLSEYYELRLSDTVQNYILSHLTVDDSGLSLRADNVNSRLLVSNGLYKLTEDITVDASKNYYTRSGTEGSYTYTKVSNPIASELATYYEAIVQPGLTLYGPDGKEVANYGEEAQIGKSDGYNIKIRSGESNARLSFCLGDLEVAYMSGDMLYIPKAVVVDAMQVGDGSTGSAWQWVIKEPSSPYAGNLTLTWMGA